MKRNGEHQQVGVDEGELTKRETFGSPQAYVLFWHMRSGIGLT